MLFFDHNGKLAYTHHCEGCERFPLEDSDEPCLMCGYTKNEVDAVREKVEVMNQLYEKHGEEYHEKPIQHSRNAFLQLHAITIGGEDYDYVTFADIDMNDDIRKLADLTDHMVELIIIPTDIAHKELNYDDEDDYFD